MVTHVMLSYNLCLEYVYGPNKMLIYYLAFIYSSVTFSSKHWTHHLWKIKANLSHFVFITMIKMKTTYFRLSHT